jgi:tetratricopeptide (TPR) repeat protein
MGAHLQRALVLYEQGRNELAEQELRQELATDTESPLAHAVLALCLSRLERFDEATAEARAAIHAAPDLPLAHYAHASVLHDRHRLPEALAATREAIRLDPSEPNHYALMSQIEFERRDWPAALAAAEQGLALDPHDVSCTNLRALALQKQGRLDQAMVTSQAALARDPENATTHAVHGMTLLGERQPKKAMEHFREALRLDPNSPFARQGIVEALKARNIVYRWMLVYFLWSARLSRGAQWGIMLGGYFGYHALASLARKQPELAPWIMPLLVAYIIFALMTWLAYPLFNLALRLHPFGKLALTPDQTRGATWVGAWLLLALCPVAAWAFSGNLTWLGLALVLGTTLMPLSAIHRCDKGWPRWSMIGYTALVLLIGLSWTAPLVVATTLPATLEAADNPQGGVSGAFWALFYSLYILIRRAAPTVFVVSVIASAFVANYLSGVTPRK